MKNILKFLAGVAVLVGCLLLSSCAVPPPKNVNNICSIFQEHPRWYWAVQDVEKKWGTPITVQMAIIHQESKFRSKIKPPRRKLLWCIPWTRPSSAVGYTQALDQTWADYRAHTHNYSASRKNFKDAVDFIGWYTHSAHKKLGIRLNDAFSLYLSYHEGMGGFKKRTYRKKPWLVKVAHKVSAREHTYRRQLAGCKNTLGKRHWWNVGIF